MKKSKKQISYNEPLNPLEVEIVVSALHNSGDFVVLRKVNLERDHRFTHKPVQGAKIGLCIDTETTGLDHLQEKIIEIGMVAFEYDPLTGAIIRIVDRYLGFEDPGFPLAKEIIEITGITDDMLAGQTFDDQKVNLLAEKASLVIAHNAAFDRKFVETRYPAFINLPWACTVSQVNWQQERISSRSLEYLLYKCGGYCINAHRALDDAEGLLALLLDTLPNSGKLVFKALLDNAGEVIAKIFAVNAPFDKKDLLKKRGYRWNDGSRGGSKGWWIDVSQCAEADELAWLAKEIYPGGNTSAVIISHIDPLARFSVREG
jgi:DNA polymerase-3 subunit epsilon